MIDLIANLDAESAAGVTDGKGERAALTHSLSTEAEARQALKVQCRSHFLTPLQPQISLRSSSSEPSQPLLS